MHVGKGDRKKLGGVLKRRAKAKAAYKKLARKLMSQQKRVVKSIRSKNKRRSKK